MINYFDYMQKLAQSNIWNALHVLDYWSNHWLGILAEMSEYTNRSYDDGAATLQKFVTSKSVDEAMQIQTGCAKREFDDYLQLMTQTGGLYAAMVTRVSASPVTGVRSQVSIMNPSHETMSEVALEPTNFRRSR